QRQPTPAAVVPIELVVDHLTGTVDPLGLKVRGRIGAVALAVEPVKISGTVAGSLGGAGEGSRPQRRQRDQPIRIAEQADLDLAGPGRPDQKLGRVLAAQTGAQLAMVRVHACCPGRVCLPCVSVWPPVGSTRRAAIGGTCRAPRE